MLGDDVAVEGLGLHVHCDRVLLLLLPLCILKGQKFLRVGRQNGHAIAKCVEVGACRLELDVHGLSVQQTLR